MTHISNSKYSRDGVWEDCSSRPAWGKKVSEIPISINELGMMADVCGSSYSGGLRLGFQSKN
jgi:hypothetical protein